MSTVALTGQGGCQTVAGRIERKRFGAVLSLCALAVRSYYDDDGHVTTIAVDPRWHRHKIGTRLLLALAREAINRGATGLTLEVRLSNLGAQALYRRFGFEPVGVRTGYYVETKEDALIMWAHEVDQPGYTKLLDALDSQVPGSTVVERPRSW